MAVVFLSLVIAVNSVFAKIMLPKEPANWTHLKDCSSRNLFQSSLSGDTALFFRGEPKSSKNKTLFPLVRNFPLKVAVDLLEHSVGLGN